MKGSLEPVRIRTKLKLFRGLPDLSPFLCVFFLLLIFFMVGTSFVQISGIKVDLPQTAGGSSFGAQKIVITLDGQGRIFFNDQLFSGRDAIESFRKTLTELRTGFSGKNMTGMTLLLRADAGAKFGDLAQILALAEKLDFNVILLTDTQQQTMRANPEME